MGFDCWGVCHAVTIMHDTSGHLTGHSDKITDTFSFISFPKPVKRQRKAVKLLQRTSIAKRSKRRKVKHHRVKLTKLPALIRKADAVFSLWIRKRDKNQCVLKSKRCKGFMQNSHLIRRGKHSVRFDELNCHTMCSYHNYLHNEYPEYYTAWFVKRYGPLPYQNLIEKSMATKKWTREELNEIIKTYSLYSLYSPVSST